METKRIHEVKSQIPYKLEEEEPKWEILSEALKSGQASNVESALTGYMKRGLREYSDYEIGEGPARFVMRYTRLLDSLEWFAIRAAVRFLSGLTFGFVQDCPGRTMVQPLSITVNEVGEGQFSISTCVRMG